MLSGYRNDRDIVGTIRIKEAIGLANSTLAGVKETWIQPNDRLVSMSELFTLRPANPKDKPLLDSYCAMEGMANLDDIEGVTVAVNAADEPVGFIQIAMGANGVAHVYPIVVHSLWRGHEVGRALIEDVHERFGELRLVSRGSSVGFYEKLGFIPCDWGLIDNEQTEGCIDCSMKGECGPLPMLLR